MNWLNLAIHKIKYKLLFDDDPRRVANYRFRKAFGRSIDWEHPRDLNEKIQWLKFYSDTSSWSRLADKYAVRDYVAEKGYGDMLVKLYGHWERAEEIDWEALPEQFVLKLNNGCGDILICRDKSRLNRRKVIRRFARLLRKGNTYGYITAEPHYATIKPCIIAEELLDHTHQAVASDTLIDYKIWCLDGEPVCIRVYMNRNRHSTPSSLYDTQWVSHPEWIAKSKHYGTDALPVPRPASLDRMLEAARAFSAGHPQMRVDLYEVDGKPYFGELTMTAANGCINSFTKEYLVELGDRVTLPKREEFHHRQHK